LLKKERKRRDEEFLVGERKGLNSNSRLANWQLKFIFRKINGYYLTLPRAAWPVDAMTSLHMEIRADICPGINWDRADKYPFNRSPSTPLMTFTFNISAQQG
jgi:hypothetical protein